MLLKPDLNFREMLTQSTVINDFFDRTAIRMVMTTLITVLLVRDFIAYSPSPYCFFSRALETIILPAVKTSTMKNSTHDIAVT